MRDISFFTDDDRYPTPTLRFVSVVNSSQARARAERLLAESGHHICVEVWENDALLFRIERGAK
jgi:hypothetical protein